MNRDIEARYNDNALSKHRSKTGRIILNIAGGIVALADFAALGVTGYGLYTYGANESRYEDTLNRARQKGHIDVFVQDQLDNLKEQKNQGIEIAKTAGATAGGASILLVGGALLEWRRTKKEAGRRRS